MAITLRNAANQNVAARADENNNLKVAIGHALVGEAVTYVHMTEPGVVYNGPVRLLGAICASSAGGTITLHDGTSTAGAIAINAFPLTSGTSVSLHNITLTTACFCNIGGTLDITFAIEPLA